MRVVVLELVSLNVVSIFTHAHLHIELEDRRGGLWLLMLSHMFFWECVAVNSSTCTSADAASYSV